MDQVHQDIRVPFLCGVLETAVSRTDGQGGVYITDPQEKPWTPRRGGLPWLAGHCRHTLLLREVSAVHVPPRGGDTRKLMSGAFWTQPHAPLPFVDLRLCPLPTVNCEHEPF